MASTLELQNVNPSDAVAHLAHAIWEQEGRPQGRDLEFWLQAESYLKASVKGQADGVAAAIESAPARSRPQAKVADESARPLPRNEQGNGKARRKPLRH
jgi:hypothetical protein